MKKRMAAMILAFLLAFTNCTSVLANAVSQDTSAGSTASQDTTQEKDSASDSAQTDAAESADTRLSESNLTGTWEGKILFNETTKSKVTLCIGETDKAEDAEESIFRGVMEIDKETASVEGTIDFTSGEAFYQVKNQKLSVNDVTIKEISGQFDKNEFDGIVNQNKEITVTYNRKSDSVLLYQKYQKASAASEKTEEGEASDTEESTENNSSDADAETNTESNSAETAQTDAASEENESKDNQNASSEEKDNSNGLLDTIKEFFTGSSADEEDDDQGVATASADSEEEGTAQSDDTTDKTSAAASVIPDGAGEYNGHHYYVYENSDYTYADAVAYCESVGGYMATITSQEENDYLYQFMKDSGYKSAYFGLNDTAIEGIWVWGNGEDVTYQNWASGEPNNSGNEDYGMFYESFTDGTWNDGSYGNGTSNDTKAFICEWGDYTQGDGTVKGGCGNGVTCTLSDEGLLTITGTGTISDNAFKGNTTIKKVVIEEGVIGIGSYTFYNCTNLTDVTLPDSLTTIGSHAFDSCTQLSELPFSDGLTTIKEYAFSNCDSIKEVSLPAGITNSGDGFWFNGCDNLTKITLADGTTEILYREFRGLQTDFTISIPDTVTTICGGAFRDCINLKQITLPKNLTKMAYHVFYNCDSLTEITIPAGVTDSNGEGDWFEACDNLTNIKLEDGSTEIPYRAFRYLNTDCVINIPDTVTTIGAAAFENSTGLTGITLPESITSISNYAFKNCTGLSKITIPDSVTTVGEGAFKNCTGLTDITLPDSLTTIGSHAFDSCTQLSGLSFPDGLTTIKEYAFSNCDSIKEVSLPAGITNSGDGFWFNGCDNLTKITLADGTTEILYREFRGLQTDFTISIPDSVTTICGGAFRDCINLKQITLPKNLTKMAYHAFYNCDSLTEITIPAGVTDSNGEGDWFEACDHLTSIKLEDGSTEIPYRAFRYLNTDCVISIPNTVTTIEAAAFENSSGLTDITLPESITSISNYAFKNCTGLTNIDIIESVTVIGDYAFEGCTGLTEINLPDSLTEIRGAAFKDCTGLTSVEIPDSVTTLGWNVFNGCTNLAEINYPKSLTSTGSDIFSGCSSLTSITVPDGVTSLPERVFQNATYLEEVTLPKGLTKIGNAAFQGCSGLSSINLPEGLETIGEYAFYGCTQLIVVGVPKTVTAINANAFNNCTALTDVYYGGTEDEWGQITISDGNDVLGDALYHYGDASTGTIRLPKKPALTVTASGHKAAKAEWTYSGDANNFKCMILYRAESGGDYEYVRTFYEKDGSWTDGVDFSGSSKDYTYKMTVRDVYGRTADSDAVSVTLVSADTEAPKAKMTPDNLKYTAINEEFKLSAAASTDNDKIASWKWDFGDGETAEGKATAHTYTKAGEYTITCTVTDNSGNSSDVSQKVTALDFENSSKEYTKIELNICDASSTEKISDAQAMLVCGEESMTFPVSDGTLTQIVPNGSYTITANASGYMARTISVEAQGGTESRTIGLTNTSIMSGDITVTEMTKEEIVAAGIDTEAEGNQHVYKFKTVLTFVAGIKTYDIPYTVVKNENNQVLSTSGGSFQSVKSSQTESGEGFDYKVGVFPISEKFALVIYGEAHWLKEMYKVALVVNNNSNTDTLEQIEAQLVLPDGMSLADMVSGTQSAVHELGSLGHMESTSTEWFVRGDKEGEYNISAKVSATAMPNGDKIEQTYTTTEPVKVYAGSALKLTITADDMVERGGEYKVKYRLENVSDKSLYNFSFGLTGSDQYEIKVTKSEEEWTEIENADYGKEFTHQIAELAPGGYYEAELAETIWFKSDLENIEFTELGTFVDIAYYLTDVAQISLEGSTTSIPYEIKINRTRESLIDKLIDEGFNQLYGDELPGGTLGGTIVELVGAEMGMPVQLIKGAKTWLKLQKGSTDHTYTISIDDGTGGPNGIYNDKVYINTGTAEEYLVDTLNGTKLTVSAGEISITARGPGGAKVKIGVTDSAGNQEREYILDVRVEDTEIKGSVKLTPDSTEGSFSVNENQIKAAISQKREQEKAAYDMNPYMWIDSPLTFELEETTSNSHHTLNIEQSSVKDILSQSATTKITVDGSVASLAFDRNALNKIIDDSGTDDSSVAITAKKLSSDEAEKLGSSNPTYLAEVIAGGKEISDFGDGTVSVSIPYTLKDGYSTEGLCVEHIKDDGTVENIPAEYDAEAKTLQFTTSEFSYFRIPEDKFKKICTHEYETVTDVAATCAAKGKEHKKCRLCGQETKVTEVPATGKHTWTKWTQKEKATIYHPETQVRTCKICKKTETRNYGKKLTSKAKLNVSGTVPAKLGQSFKINVTGLAAGDYVVSWKSSNKKVATVSKTGTVKAASGKKMAKKSVTITATLASGKKLSFKVKLQKTKVKTKKLKASIAKKTIRKGKTAKITSIVTPITSTDKVTYKSSNKKVADVTSKGVVKAKKPGKATITVKAGKKTVKIKVKVKK